MKAKSLNICRNDNEMCTFMPDFINLQKRLYESIKVWRNICGHGEKPDPREKNCRE